MKKLFFLAVAMLLCVVPLVACQSNAPAPTVAPTATPVSEASAEPTEAPVADGPMTKYETVVELTYPQLLPLDPKYPEGQDMDNNIWMTEYMELLGIKLNKLWSTTGVEQYETKLNLSIASGELPDIIPCTNMGQLSRLIDAGLVADLTDVYDKYATPLAKESLNSDGGLALSQVTVGGKLWALPEGAAIPGNLEYTYIREDWRLKLGLDVPKTTEDLLAMAEAFARNDPDGNGKADTYGIVIGNQPYENYMNFRGFANNFGAYPTIWIKKDGKLAYGSVQPEMKNALAAMAKLYQDGVIDKEFVAKNAFAASSDAVAGKGGICFGQFWLITWPLPDTNKNNGDNSTMYWKPYPIYNTATPTAIKGTMAQVRVTNAYMVNKDCAHPEALMKLYNLFNERLAGQSFDAAKYHTDPKTNHSIFMLAPVKGYGGGNKNVNQNINVTKAIDTGDLSVLIDAEQKATYDNVKAYLDGNKDSAHLTQYYLFYGPDSTFGLEKAANDSGNIVLDQFYGADTPEMLRRMSILRSQEEAMILDIITGNKPVEYFDEFVANWMALGGETITFEVNQWYEKVK